MERRKEINQYLTFRLGEEVFGLDIGQVREVLDVTPLTRVPQTPPFMRGVINLRGSVVPVVDLRRKFGLPEIETTVNTCIIIVEIQLDGDTTVLGALADSVQEVIELDPSEIEPPPKIGTRLKTEFLKGMGRQEEKFLMILDIDQVFSTEELSAIKDSETSVTASVPGE